MNRDRLKKLYGKALLDETCNPRAKKYIKWTLEGYLPISNKEWAILELLSFGPLYKGQLSRMLQRFYYCKGFDYGAASLEKLLVFRLITRVPRGKYVYYKLTRKGRDALRYKDASRLKGAYYSSIDSKLLEHFIYHQW